MSYCPLCTRPIPYGSTLLRGLTGRTIWCEHCRVGLQRKTSWATWAWLCVIVVVNIAGLAWGFWAMTLPLIVLDFYVDTVTLKLVPIRLNEAAHR